MQCIRLDMNLLVNGHALQLSYAVQIVVFHFELNRIVDLLFEISNRIK